MEPKIALVYIRNGEEIVFPVKDIQHAVSLADNIAESDLLNESIAFNMFDVCQCNGRLDIGDSWESEEGENFEAFWRRARDGTENL